MEVFGIATVRRQIFLWNGTQINRTVPPDQKLKDDLPNIKIIRQVDLKPGESIELPSPRGGHASCIIGNP
jgi:hypothetical protein